MTALAELIAFARARGERLRQVARDQVGEVEASLHQEAAQMDSLADQAAAELATLQSHMEIAAAVPQPSGEERP